MPYYEKALGLKCEHREEVASQKVRTAFFTVGDVISNSSSRPARTVPLPNFWRKIPSGGIHHVAFGTSDVTASSGQASAAGVKLIQRKTLRRRRAASWSPFFIPSPLSASLTELCMPKTLVFTTNIL